jgi:hypothetical protein
MMTAKAQQKKQREAENLDERYGKIGIPALVAALAYQRSDGRDQRSEIRDRIQKQLSLPSDL